MAGQFKRLLWKQWVFCKRHPVKWILFFVLPLILLAFVILSVLLLKNDDIPDCDYETGVLPGSNSLAYLNGLICSDTKECISPEKYKNPSEILTNPQMNAYFKNGGNVTNLFCDKEGDRRRKMMMKAMGKNTSASKCPKYSDTDEYSDIKLLDFIMNGMVLYYPDSEQAKAIMNNVGLKLQSHTKLVRKFDIYTNAYGELSDSDKEQFNLGLIDNLASFITAKLKCYNNSRTGRVMGFESRQKALDYAKETKMNEIIVWGVVGLNFETADLASFDLLSHTSERNSEQALHLQNLVETAIQNETTNSQIFSYKWMPRACRKNGSIYSSIFGIFQMCFAFGFVLIVATITSEMAVEKSTGLEEYLKIVGVQKWKLKLSWWVYWLPQFLLIGILIALVMKFMPKNIFESTDVTILLVLMILLSTSCLAFCFLLASIVTKPQQVTIVVMIFAIYAWLVPSMSGLVPFVGYKGMTAINVRVSCLYSPIAAIIGVAYILEKEAKDQKVAWNTLFDSPAADGDDFHGLGEAMIFILLDILLYLILAWYFEHIITGKYGTKWPFYFCCLPRYWSNNVKNNGDDDDDDDEEIRLGRSNKIRPTSADIEQTDSNNKSGIQIQNLTKVFGKDFKAVDNVTANFYSNEITAFLGHNGAGKSTTMNMLTGMLPPTSGRIIINGVDARKDMKTVRKSLGFCPQYDILYPDLTVREHADFFGDMLGLSEKQIAAFLDDVILGQMKLAHAGDTASKSLSGGMKRKLSIALAFMGKPSTVILDEPTSAIDPFSRRAIWDVILANRSDCAILVSTHYMQEADLLGDRIAIINKGRLKCIGSSIYLKTKYGSGLTLTVAHDRKFNAKAEMKTLNKLCRLKLENTGTTETNYSVKFEDSQSKEMIELLEKMEQKVEQNNIRAFGLTESTLEKVFFNVVDEGMDEKNGNGADGDENEVDVDLDSEKGSGSLRKTDEIATGCNLYCLQFVACIIKRFNLARKSIVGLIMQVLAPVLLTLLLLLLNNRVQGNSKKNIESRSMNPWNIIENNFNIFFSSYPENAELVDSMKRDGISYACTGKIDNVTCSGSGYTGSDKKSWENSDYKCPSCAKTCEVSAVSDSAKSKLPTNDKLFNLNGKNITEVTLKSDQLGLFAGLEVKSWTNGIFDEYFNVLSSNSDENFVKIRQSLEDLKAYFPTQLTEYRIWSGAELQGDRKPTEKEKLQVQLRSSFLNAFSNVILRTGASESAYKWTSFDNEEVILKGGEADMLTMVTGFMFSFLGTFAFMMPICAVLLFIVTENQSGNKRLQSLMGLNLLVYWLSNFFWDFLLYVFSTLLVVVIVAIFNSTFDLHLGGLFVCALMYGVNMILASYVLSHIFKTGRNAVMFVVIATAFLTIGSIILRFWSREAWYDGANGCLDLLPPYFAGDSFFTVSMFRKISLPGETIWGEKYLRKPLSAAILCLIILLCILIFIEVQMWKRIKNCCCGNAKNAGKKQDSAEEHSKTRLFRDADVILEEKRIQDDNYKNEDDALLAKEISKVYGNGKVAINGVTFGVKKGECFGLLGVNGAGKTTLFKILTKFHPPTSGTASINDVDIFTGDSSQIANSIGYCPQEDILFESLTVEQHLYLYSKIRGISGKDNQRQVIDSVIKTVGLEPHREKKSTNLSGGNKRKLNFAIAIINNPSVIFLDEMTTGMDPKARRATWNCLEEALKNGCSAVITSHSMEECEALCDRIVIMVSGEFSCMGSIQYLKNKFGNNYTVKFKLAENKQSELYNKIMKKFPETKIIDEHTRFLEIQLPADDLKLSDLFGTIHKLKDREDMPIDVFTASQTTLEHVFVNMIKQQE